MAHNDTLPPPVTAPRRKSGANKWRAEPTRWARDSLDDATIRNSVADPTRTQHGNGLNPISEKRTNSSLSTQPSTGTVVRGHIVAVTGEFLGTTAFLFFAFAGTQIANNANTSYQGAGPHPDVLMYIALSFGISLLVNVWVFYRVSGGLFNPSVTLAMFLTGAVPWFRAILLCIAQMLGSILASGLVVALFPSDLNVNTVLSNGVSTARGLFIEAILTMELVFTILMLAKEKHKATFMAPIGIGLALFIAELVGVYYTGGSLNTARSFGPAVVSGSFRGTHWIYWLGPTMGSLAAVGLYKVYVLLHYEIGNPGQDEESEEKAAETTEAVIARAETESDEARSPSH